MALIKCPNCQKDVSSMVTYCPFCNTDLSQIKTIYESESNYYDSNRNFHDSNDTPRSMAGDFYHAENSSIEPESTRHETEPESAVSFSSSRQSGSAPHSPARTLRKRKKSAPPGRRLLGYQTGHPFYMLLSVAYHMAASVGILYAFHLSPYYAENGILLYHLCRVILAAIMLFLPMILLTKNKLRKKLPLFRSRKPVFIATGFLILYLPLAALFLLSCQYCIS